MKSNWAVRQKVPLSGYSSTSGKCRHRTDLTVGLTDLVDLTILEFSDKKWVSEK